MNKSASYGQFREDAYIVMCSSSYRYVMPLNSHMAFHYCKDGMRLDDTRAYVRENHNSLKVLDRTLLSKPWQCECEAAPFTVELTPVKTQMVKPVTAPVAGLIKLKVGETFVEGNVEDMRALLGF